MGRCSCNSWENPSRPYPQKRSFPPPKKLPDCNKQTYPLSEYVSTPDPKFQYCKPHLKVLPYFSAIGFTGDPAPLVKGITGATSRNAH